MKNWEEPVLKEWNKDGLQSYLAEVDPDLDDLLSPMSLAYMRGTMALERLIERSTRT